MNATQTRRFQELHLRHVQGEVLPTDELAFYQTTLAELDAQELNEVRVHQGGSELRIQELETEFSSLQAHGSHLREQLTRLRQTPRVHAV